MYSFLFPDGFVRPMSVPALILSYLCREPKPKQVSPFQNLRVRLGSAPLSLCPFHCSPRKKLQFLRNKPAAGITAFLSAQ